MIKYLVKETSVGTEQNPNFAGHTHISYHGKQGNLCFEKSSMPYEDEKFEAYFPYFAREYGYNRICDAKKSYTYKNPENTKYWQSKVEIVMFEC